MTTEKELDTVEVLKAIQKAKDVKSKLSHPEKKVGIHVRGGREVLGETGLWNCLEPLSAGCTSLVLRCEMGQ